MKKLLTLLAGICLAMAAVTGAFCEGPAIDWPEAACGSPR